MSNSTAAAARTPSPGIGNRSEPLSSRWTRLSWVISTPLGVPVDPEVKTRYASRLPAVSDLGIAGLAGQRQQGRGLEAGGRSRPCPRSLSTTRAPASSSSAALRAGG